MSTEQDGGYFAIKGFLYQFDKTLLEVLRNPALTVSFENVQDINYQDYVLQIKHKETQDFAPSKIQKAVGQLLNLFAKDESLRFILYCHFKDKSVQDWQPTLQELDAILTKNVKPTHDDPTRSRFLKNFTVRFSQDYETQFKELIALIKSSFSLGTDDEAILCHSIFRSKLLDRSVLLKAQRNVSREELNSFLTDAQSMVFHCAYAKYLGAQRYEKLLRQEYFTFKSVNIENFQRLFVVDCDPTAHQVDLQRVVTQLARKYFRKGKSPPPYVALVNLPETTLRDVKRALRDDGLDFFDGTHFDGDRFRLSDLVADAGNKNLPTVKLVPESEIKNALASADVREIFQFYVRSPVDMTLPKAPKHIRIQIDQTAQVLRIIS